MTNFYWNAEKTGKGRKTDAKKTGESDKGRER